MRYSENFQGLFSCQTQENISLTSQGSQMQAISLWLAAAIVILTGWAIVKKYQVNMVLFIAGLLLNIILSLTPKSLGP